MMVKSIARVVLVRFHGRPGYGELSLYWSIQTTRFTEWKARCISNAICWSPDDKIIFRGLLKRTMWAYDFDASAGTIENRRTFIGFGG